MKQIASQKDWIERARQVLPAGGFGNFDPHIVIREGRAARIWDEDGREYVDYLIGSGPMLLGHGHPEVLETVFETVSMGQTFFANNRWGIMLAEEICEAVPCIDQLRYVSSGGEADMYAMRLARAYTGRQKIIKFEGGYHGMSAEAQMSLAPERSVPFPEAIPDSAGISAKVAQDILVAPFNDISYLEMLLPKFQDEVAAIIVEPLQRIIPPVEGFLQYLREACDRYGILLIFDEIVTGFRLAYGGAQEYYGVTPDLCTLGKVIGGGFPLAAIGGRREIMDHFDKDKVGSQQWLMQIGTLSGNPVAAAAGHKSLEILRREGAYVQLRQTGQSIMEAIDRALGSVGVSYHIVGDPTLFDVLFCPEKPRHYRDTLKVNQQHAQIWNSCLRQKGVFKSPGKIYPCLALTEADLQHTTEAINQAALALGEAMG